MKVGQVYADMYDPAKSYEILDLRTTAEGHRLADVVWNDGTEATYDFLDMIGDILQEAKEPVYDY